MPELTNEQFQEIQTLTKSMREKLDQAEAEKAKYGEALAETKASIDAMNSRIDTVEVSGKRHAIETGSGANAMTEAQAEHAKAFYAWARKDEKGCTPEQLKTLTVNSDPDGGYTVPVTMHNQIISKLIEFSPVRELATVVTIGSGDTIKFPVEDTQNFAASWVGETAARPETTSGQLRLVALTAHELYANPFVSQTLLDDSGFNIEAWLADRVSMRFAVTEGTAFISGTGSGQPEGLLTNASVTTVTSATANVIGADDLKDMFYALPEYYTRNAAWLMRRATVGAIRKLKDGNGNYLWQPGLTADAPPTIEGRPYREAVDMPAIATGAKPVLFGDIRAGYTIVDRQGIRVTRDPLSNKPYVEFYHLKRTGGGVVLPEAFRTLTIA
jgi:HK97 family phage major capsid protein